VAKKRRVLVLEFPGEPDDQSVRDNLAHVQAKLASAGHGDVEVIVLTGGWRLREVCGPAAKTGPQFSKEEFAVLSEQMYDALTKG
jgi:hypothetical protein